VSAELAALPGVEIHAHDPSGKLILTLETADEAAIVERLNAIYGIRGVLSAALVFHHIEQITTRG
jgi:nitrate reductase NapD